MQTPGKRPARVKTTPLLQLQLDNFDWYIHVDGQFNDVDEDSHSLEIVSDLIWLGLLSIDGYRQLFLHAIMLVKP